jgi:ribonuclease Z
MTSRLRVTLLGSGSPSPSLDRCHPAVLVEWGAGSCVLVDAGDGVVGQLQRAEANLAAVEHVALTHMHWDHILGYPAFVWGSWIKGRRRLATFGPRGTVDMHERLVESYYRDQALWAIDVGFRPDGWHETTVEDVEPGWSTEIDGCVISAGAVVHPPMAAVAFRFDYEGKSIVISGDTAECRELVEFSIGADLLVVDACAVTPSPSLPAERRALIERLHGFHASPDECVSMAHRAKVGHVVLTHHLPDTTPTFERGNYPGVVTIGEDFDTYEA